jgi:hypothetical protein
MSLTIKKSNWDPSTSLSNASPLQKSLWVSFGIYNTDMEGTPLEDALLYKNFSLVLQEPLEFQIETDWTESAGAEIAKRVNQIFNPKAIKAFAGEYGKSHAPNDNWTQKTTEIGKPLSTKLKFRIYDTTYDEPNNKNQTYSEMIRFLTLTCSPRVQYALTSNAVEPLIAAAKNSKDFFSQLKSATKPEKKAEEPGIINSISSYFSGKNKTASLNETEEDGGTILNNISAGVKTFKNIVSNTLSKSVRYNYTLRIESAILNSNEVNNLEPDWYIKSFNWTPSTEIVTKDNRPYPLWIDFDVDVETCIVWPSEMIVANFN